MLRLPILLCFGFLFFACQSTTSNTNNEASSPEEVLSPETSVPETEPVPDIPETPKDWSNPKTFIPDAIFDLRYATTNNFVGEQLYPCATCWLRPPVAEALASAADSLRQAGYRIVLFDCYRPLPIQERLWAIKPDATYVTPPSRGSMHNRGLAVDIGLADMEGKLLDMGTPFDFFGRAAHQDFYDHKPEVLQRRTLLKETMISAGFGPIRSEWWHYSYRNHSAALSREQWPCPKVGK